MIDLQPYLAYKDSGVPWLGSVPGHWEMRSLGSLVTPKNARGRRDLPLLSVVREKGVIPRSSMAEDENHNYIPDDLRSYKVVRRGDLAINKMKAWQGSMGVSAYDGVVSPAYFVYEFRMENLQFGQALLRSKPYVAFFARASDGVRVGQWDLSIAGMKRIPVVIPPPAEQTAIVQFLDHQDRLIRTYIRAKQKLIALLNEQKQAIIQHAVTRGLNPDVRLKPSGVEWLGEIPEHWEVLRSKYIFREIDERSSTGKETHLSMSQKFGLVPNDQIEERRLISESYVGAKVCRRDDLVLNRLKAHLGVFALASVPGLVSPDYTVFRSLHPVDPRYFELVYRTPACRIELRKRAKGIVQGFWRLYTDDFYDISVPVPSLQEQAAIVRGIDQRLPATNAAITCAEREIALFREYRTRLIADVVTGKVDVREAANGLEEAEEPDVEEAPESDDAIEDSHISQP